MKLALITIELFQKAIQIYIKFAYPLGIKKNSFCYNNYKKFTSAKSLNDVLKVFEKILPPEKDSKSKKRYEVRLGSEKYPYIKLVLQESFKNDDYGFLIDRHTEFLALYSTSKSYENENIIKDYTRKLKYQIEDEFIKNNIPTYREIVKEFNIGLYKIKSDFNIKSNGINILLVEDDQDISELYKLNLEILGYNVDSTENGKEALSRLNKKKYDIMILDLMIPNISGFEILEKENEYIPIIVLSSLFDELTKKRCLNYGAKKVITKPVEIEKLDEVIKEIINEK